MFTPRKLLILGLIAVGVMMALGIGGLLSWSRSTAADSTHSPLFQQSYTLNAKQDDALFVMADTVELGSKSVVDNDVALIVGSRSELGGIISGDVVVMGGAVLLAERARIQGDVALIVSQAELNGRLEGSVEVVAQQVTIGRGARLSDGTTVCTSALVDLREDAPPVTQCSEADRADLQTFWDGSWREELLRSGGVTVEGFWFTGSLSLALTGMAALLVALFPHGFSFMSESLHRRPGRMLLIGVLSTAGMIGLWGVALVVLAWVPLVGLIGLLLLALISISLGVLIVLGWVAVALLIGNALLSRWRSRRVQPPLFVVVVGSLVLFLVWHGLALLPYGWMLALLGMAVLGCAGLGAVLATRVGTRAGSRAVFVQG
jgi:hypothetical protein